MVAFVLIRIPIPIPSLVPKGKAVIIVIYHCHSRHWFISPLEDSLSSHAGSELEDLLNLCARKANPQAKELARSIPIAM